MEQKKYPVVAGILRELTPERIKKEIEEVKNVKLPAELQKWVEEYEKIGSRDRFLWKMWYKIFSVESFPVLISPSKYENFLRSIKLLITMFVVQLDDVVDKRRKEKLLQEVLNICLKENNINTGSLSLEDKKYLVFTKKLWDCILRKIRKYPNYKEMEEVFYYDFYQIINTMKFARLVNKKLNLINRNEYWLYFTNNMAFFIGLDVNMMCTNKNNLKNLNIFRTITYEAQIMGRICNWVTTWQREIKDKDFTSGIFAYAIDKDIISVGELNEGSENKIIKKINKAKIERSLLEKWENSYNKIDLMTGKIRNSYISSYLRGQKYLFMIDLVTKNYK